MKADIYRQENANGLETYKKKLTLIANRGKRLNEPKNKNLKVRQGQVLVGNI